MPLLIRPAGLTNRLRLTLLLASTGGSLWLLPSMAVAVEFQSGFMRQAGTEGAAAAELALTRLSQQNSLSPGRYPVNIVVNLKPFAERTLAFDLDANTGQLHACLTTGLLTDIGVRLEALAPPLPGPDSCVDLPVLIPEASAYFDSRQLSLSLSIPQIALRREISGRIDPARWDSGINAAFINYQASAQQATGRGNQRHNSDDLYLNGGFNLGQWRVRSSQSLRQNPEGQRQWTRAYSYVQRDLPGTHANLTLGETSSGGDVFRSLPIKGLVIASDMAMLPDMLQGYAPVIRGVANSRAKLEVLNNGYPIYSTYVSAGPYQIDDLSIGGGSGELEVVLTEADGQVRRFTQSYATLGNLMREGVWRYGVSVGRYNPVGKLDDPMLAQGTLALGTAWDMTLYGGLQGAGFYHAATLGAARDLGRFGALALDVTRSAADIDNGQTTSVSGMSYALKYGKAFATDTSLRFAGYRYSTEGYRDFAEAVRERSRESTWRGSRRSRLEASVFQNLGKASTLSLTLSQEDFWHSSYQQRQFQLNFTRLHRGVSYNLFASQALQDDSRSRNDRQFGINVSFPLDLGHSNSATLGYLDSGGRHSQNARLTGSAMEQRLSYSTSLSNDQRSGQAGSVAATWQAPFASLGAGFTQGRDYRSTSMNASGSVLLHADGVELGPHLGETVALVHVPDIAGVGLSNAAGVSTNARGYALMPHLRPYRVNQLALNTDALGAEIEIDNGAAQVVPRRGAIVKTTFNARQVNRFVLTLSLESGQPLPFGAQVLDSEGTLLGSVGQGGQVLLVSGEQPQTLQVRWGEQHTQRCEVQLDPTAMQQRQGYRLQALDCRS